MSEGNSPIKSASYSLDFFEGPLDLLVHLIQKGELAIFDLVLENLTSQLLKKMEKGNMEIDDGADAMWWIASLAHFKSRKLLPSFIEDETEEEDLRMNLMEHLIEYQKYKQAASVLEQRELDQSAYYVRKAVPLPKPTGLRGLEEVSLSQLFELLSHVMREAEKRETDPSIPNFLPKESKWSVQETIEQLKTEFKPGAKIPFFEFFSADKCQEELIVLFLSLLELLKLQILKVIQENEHLSIWRG